MGRSVAGGGADGRLGAASDVKRDVNCVRTSKWLSVKGANGEPGDGLRMACRMSCTPARMRSLEEARGMGLLVGNQASVSQTLVARVSHIHTV